MSPKEKVRAEIYKKLLNEEKRKNKNMSIFSLGLFFVGIVGATSFNSFMDKLPSSQTAMVAFAGKAKEDELVASMYRERIINRKNIEFNPDELFIYKTEI